MTILEKHIIKSLPLLSIAAKREALKVLGVPKINKRISKKTKFDNFSTNRKYKNQ